MAGNWFDAIGKAMDEGARDKERLDAWAVERDLARANERVVDLKAGFNQLCGMVDQRDAYIRELHAKMDSQDRKINTLHEENTFLNQIIRAENKALIQATGDVAQLINIDPHIVSTRYKLATIDLIQREMNGGALDANYGNTEWRQGVSFGIKMKLRIRKMQEYNHLIQNKRASYSEAMTAVRNKFKCQFHNITDCYYWLDWNPELFSSEAPPDIMKGYQAIDDLLVRAINLKTAAIPAGALLKDTEGRLTQRADSLAGVYKEGGKAKSVGMHPWVQENLYENWTPAMRTFGRTIEQQQKNVVKLGQFLCKKYGFDITRDDAVKPPIKNKDQQSSSPAPNKKGH